ncbi:MAG TPA: preprotein translocase subunit SecA [Chromatiales bacterium]|nr:preprotein translocase subunit SecA [Chromatiales bacterium]
MVAGLVRKIFGSRNDRAVKRLRKLVAKVGGLEESTAALTDAELKSKTDEFRQRVAEGETLDQMMAEAFAVVREAGKRVMQMRHFDEQLIGGAVLHSGKIAEMRTGEGKTLVATLAAYLNALSGKGVHVVTVNDYLARRDSEWMGRLYTFLGMTVGVIVGGLPPEDRAVAYAADITYGTNNEFGFDFLRDNMVFTREQKVQRELNFAIVDEVDSILIDEARTPLVISGPTDDNSELYSKMNDLIPELQRQEEEDGPGDYGVDEKGKQVYLTEDGHQAVEDLLSDAGLLAEGTSLYDAANIMLMHHINAALRAHVLFERDVEYIVQADQIVIVDEFTGRTMQGRRWGEGLHQAIEAKEGVEIRNENQTLASITFQNYFRMFDKLAGMTGTADTEAFEFQQIYGLEVLVIPTHLDMVREDMGDLVYLTPDEKYAAISEDIADCVERGQPALVGTASIEVSETISDLLTKQGVKHEVLNAKQHEKEAGIIAQAGQPGAVTVATNMAGRGTDIVLGGSLEVELATLGGAAGDTDVERVRAEWQTRHDQVVANGGLHVIGTERHESRRIDNQLRGRSGRQGDPGSSRFYLSLEDSLMRIFASDRVAGLMQKLGMEEGEAIEHPWVSKAIENAQRKVEGRNFDIRKSLLEFDDVANDQRKVIYEQRNDLMEADEVSATIEALRYDIVNSAIDTYIVPQSLEEQWDIPGLSDAIEHEFATSVDIQSWLHEDDDLHEESLRDRILEDIITRYQEKETQAGSESMRHFEKAVMLQVVDNLWKEHLSSMDYLRKSIHLRGYAQKNPKQEYKREAFDMFSQLLDNVKIEVISVLSKVQIRNPEDAEMEEQKPSPSDGVKFQHDNPKVMHDGSGNRVESEEEFSRKEKAIARKVGRNKPCPCGSGKKFKHCHGKLA